MAGLLIRRAAEQVDRHIESSQLILILSHEGEVKSGPDKAGSPGWVFV